MPDTVAQNTTPAAAPANPVAAAKEQARQALFNAKPKSPESPGAPPEPAAPPPETKPALTDLAKLSAKNREYEAKLKELEPQAKTAQEIAEARKLYASDRKAGLAKLLGVDSVDAELEALAAVYFQAPGGKEEPKAAPSVEETIAEVKARQDKIEQDRKDAEQKAKDAETAKQREAARDATFKVIDGFVKEGGEPEFPYLAKNKDSANQHVITTAIALAKARNVELQSAPDADVTALLKESAGLVEAELADIAKTRFTLAQPVPSDTITPKPTTQVVDRASSVPQRTAAGTNVPKPVVSVTTQKTHQSVAEAKEALKKALRSARHN